MIRSTWLVGAAAALTVGLAAATAEAAPATGAATGLKAAAGENSAVQDVHWGRRRYREYYGAPYWGYYSHYPRYYSYGYSPGIRLYYGGPRRHHRHHRRWW